MNRRKAYPFFSVAAMLLSILALFMLLYLSGSELEDHWKSFVTTGDHAAYLAAVFSNPKVLACLAAVLGTGIAAIAVDARAIHREERGALILLILVCLSLAAFAVLFWLLLKVL